LPHRFFNLFFIFNFVFLKYFKNYNYIIFGLKFEIKKVLRTHTSITMAVRFFHTLFAQHASTLNRVIVRCSLQLNCHKNLKNFPAETDSSNRLQRSETEEILDSILPPREWEENGQLWRQSVSSTPATRLDVINLQVPILAHKNFTHICKIFLANMYQF
jgi:hypothetical protein